MVAYAHRTARFRYTISSAGYFMKLYKVYQLHADRRPRFMPPEPIHPEPLRWISWGPARMRWLAQSHPNAAVSLIRAQVDQEWDEITRAWNLANAQYHSRTSAHHSPGPSDAANRYVRAPDPPDEVQPWPEDHWLYGAESSLET